MHIISRVKKTNFRSFLKKIHFPRWELVHKLDSSSSDLDKWVILEYTSTKTSRTFYLIAEMNWFFWMDAIILC